MWKDTNVYSGVNTPLPYPAKAVPSSAARLAWDKVNPTCSGLEARSVAAEPADKAPPSAQGQERHGKVGAATPRRGCCWVWEERGLLGGGRGAAPRGQRRGPRATSTTPAPARVPASRRPKPLTFGST